MVNFYFLLTVALPLSQAIHLLLTNDDGWDDPNIRAFFNLLDTTTDHELILCSPESANPEPSKELLPRQAPEDLLSMPGDDPGFSSGDSFNFDEDRPLLENVWSPTHDAERVQYHRERWPYGSNASDIRLNHVPFGPKTAIHECIARLGRALYKDYGPHLYWHKTPPELVLAGPKVGSSLGYYQRTDRVLAAFEDHDIEGLRPSITFAGANDRLDPSRELSSKIYAQLATIITQTVIQSGNPYLPKHSHLHVNFPHVTDEKCNNADDFKFILTTNSQKIRNLRRRKYCGSRKLPFETNVVNRKDGCYVSISLLAPPYVSGQGPDMSAHFEMAKKLDSILNCLPETT